MLALLLVALCLSVAECLVMALALAALCRLRVAPQWAVVSADLCLCQVGRARLVLVAQ